MRTALFVAASLLAEEVAECGALLSLTRDGDGSRAAACTLTSCCVKQARHEGTLPASTDARSAQRPESSQTRVQGVVGRRCGE